MADWRTGAGAVQVRLDSFAAENKKYVHEHDLVIEQQECALGSQDTGTSLKGLLLANRTI